MGVSALLATLFVPLAGAIAVMFIHRDQAVAAKRTALVFSLIAFVASLFLLPQFQADNTSMQYVINQAWIPSLDAGFRIGIDGLSLPLVLLTALIMPIALLASFDPITKNVKSYYALMLLLQFGMTGVFIAWDTFLFYIFWELILIPMYFIIGIWGGKDRIYAAVKFFLYTLVGSLLMLIAIIWLGLEVGAMTGNGFTANLAVLREHSPMIAPQVQTWLFLAFALSFLIKVPLFPLS